MNVKLPALSSKPVTSVNPNAELKRAPPRDGATPAPAASGWVPQTPPVGWVAASGARGASLRALLTSLTGAPEAQKLEELNEWVNRNTTYAEDAETYAQRDYWASPVETLNRGVGDCEDFSILKYFALKQAGVPDERLRIAYVRTTMQQAHMVVTVTPEGGGEPLVLDNLIHRIAPLSRRSDLQLVFTFNKTQVFDAAGANAGEASRLRMWTTLLERAEAQGHGL